MTNTDTADIEATARQVAALARAGSEFVRITVDRDEAVAAVPHIRTILDRERKGKGKVVLLPRIGDSQDVEIQLPGGFNVTPRLAQALKLIPGVERVEEV